MKCANKVTLIGNVGKPPELKTINYSIKVLKLPLATTESYYDKEHKLQTSTLWHELIFWNKLAETAQTYLRKGSYIYIEGKINYRTYESKEGLKKTVTEIIVNELILLDKKQKSAVVESEIRQGK